ncbi:acyl-CoA thioesterase [Gillisia sp. M10.2A]|uniref:Acyl-CoA thioesterase n=1 Tax=Gillisia lutea TaxID=2909668 RepID=A0ABS9EJL2_9FLAO|nr:acyl-CoA thioesterase [Gillisia lutea]MCF4101641.1 acyl-CoA thioesterase [Gillisia lutea]
MVAQLTSSTKLKVRFNECDPLNIVWHGNYLKYFEDAREDFCLQHNISYLHVKAHGISTPIVKSSCEHKLPLKYGDHFIVETTFIPSVAAKMIFRYKIVMANQTIATGETVQVFLDTNGNLQLNNPSFFLDWKKKMSLI